ncbi:MAG: desampylase [Haloferacaceae archaeon]
MPGFTREAYDEIVSRARHGGDAEVCGVLGGRAIQSGSGPVRSGIDAVVTTVYPVENVAASPRSRYELDPEEQLAAIEELTSRDLTLIGFYHSHPRGPPIPSETDLESATWPDASYVIVAFDGEPYVGSWRWDGEAFQPEAVRLVPGDSEAFSTRDN